MGSHPTVGLVTHFGDNYGACLQAYATQMFVNNAGYDCQLVNYYPCRCRNKLHYCFCRAQRLLFHPYDICKHRILRLPIKGHLSTRHQAFNYFRKKYLKIDNCKHKYYDDFYRDPPQYDMFVCGSDQIWNPTFYEGCNPVYYLDFVPPEKKRISYASSIGLSDIPEKYQKRMIQFLNRMSALGVREVRAAEIVEELTGRKAQVVVDPTFLLDADQWRQLESKYKTKDPYILFYLWGNEPFIDEFKNTVIKKTGLPAVCLPYRMQEYYGDENKIFDAGPHDFFHLIDNAALVVTDSFHATTISIICRTPFYTLSRQRDDQVNNMNSRFHTIVNKLGLKNRFIASSTEFPDQIQMDVDFDYIYSHHLKPWREESISYLLSSLGE